VHTVQRDGAKITLVEVSPGGVANTFEAVEQGERFVVFSNPDHGRLGFRHGDGALELTIEHADATIERHRLSLEI
jgi:hypothetical protein